jgi:hypothetical protein
MKPQFLFISVIAAGGAAIASPTPGSELRKVLQRDSVAAPAPAPRQLTEGERAELRRQLSVSRPLPPPVPDPRMHK